MIFNAHKYTLELLRFRIFNVPVGDILLIERCYLLQGTLFTRRFECNINPRQFCMNLKRVMITEISRVRAINKEIPFNKRN